MTSKLKTKKQKFMKQAMQDQQICICQKCGTVYQIKLLKPGEGYNDFGNRFCHYCGNLTESFPDWVKTRIQIPENNYVLITISGGLIDQVKFYSKALQTLKALSTFVETMDIESQDAAIYNQDGYFANAKDFLDENDKFMENPEALERT